MTDEGDNIMYLNLSTNLTLKKKRHTSYFTEIFEKLTLDELLQAWFQKLISMNKNFY